MNRIKIILAGKEYTIQTEESGSYVKQLAESLTGVPAPIETTDRVVCIVEYRDGTVIDVIRQIKR